MNNLVYLKNDEPVCSSLQVAEKFGKRHADVMRSIDNLIKNDLFAYISKPRKNTNSWISNGELCKSLRMLNIDFPMIKWSDDEPWLIEDLKNLEVVEEYE